MNATREPRSRMGQSGSVTVADQPDASTARRVKFDGPRDGSVIEVVDRSAIHGRIGEAISDHGVERRGALDHRYGRDSERELRRASGRAPGSQRRARRDG